MGGSYYSRDDADARATLRSSVAKDKGIPIVDAAFAYNHDIKTGKTAARVHPSLTPKGVKIREARDSKEHPVTVPIIVTMDTTGSMRQVPEILQSKLSHLMGSFLDDKASGKKYLGDGYPAIMISAVDDYPAMRKDGALQVGQFESGIEIDDNLTNLWLTGNGGGTYQESYELAMYFAAYRTVHDHWEKRHRKGYMFIIGDEHAYSQVTPVQVTDVIGGTDLSQPMSLEAVVKEVKKRYNLFFILPNMTSYYDDPELLEYWTNLLGQQNVIKLADPNKICETIVGAVAICEEHIGIDDLRADLDMGGVESALVPLAKATVAGHSGDGLPDVPGTSSGVERL
jgi:hypothetical protein